MAWQVPAERILFATNTRNFHIDAIASVLPDVYRTRLVGMRFLIPVRIARVHHLILI
jgi:3-hydroxyacyl-CoA dehydrogenase